MARVTRLVVEGEPAVYHLVSGTALDGFPLGDVEKEHMVRLLKSLSGLFFVEVLGFSVLGNHVHIVVRAQPGGGISDDDIRKRLVAFYGEETGKTLGEGDLEALRARLGSVSSYMKELKESFTRFYNQKHGRRGFFWGGRFKSVLVEDGDALINPVPRPWASFGRAILQSWRIVTRHIPVPRPWASFGRAILQSWRIVTIAA